MTTRTAQADTRRGRPRSERAQQAILTAAADLLLERGLDAVSVDALAESAGVSKATIYRWWPTKEAVALDALAAAWAGPGLDAPDTGTLRGDLLALLRPWLRRVKARPYARVLGAFIAKAHSDPAFAAEYLARVVTPRREIARTVLGRAIERGEIRPDVPVDVALDVIYGAIYHRLLHGHAPLTDRFVTEVVDTVLNGLLAHDADPEVKRP
jgi:AcrR family transcriptional regulator